MSIFDELVQANNELKASRKKANTSPRNQQYTQSEHTQSSTVFEELVQANNTLKAAREKDLSAPQKQYSYGNRIASGAKSLVSGAVGAIQDILSLPYNVAAGAHNIANSNGMTSDPDHFAFGGTEPVGDVPSIPSATHALNQGIDNITDGYTETPEDQKAVNQGLEFAGGIAGGGGIAKLATAGGKAGLAKTASYTGSLNPWQVGGGAATGATISTLEDAGAGTGESFAGGLASGVAFSNTPNVLGGY